MQLVARLARPPRLLRGEAQDQVGVLSRQRVDAAARASQELERAGRLGAPPPEGAREDLRPRLARGAQPGPPARSARASRTGRTRASRRARRRACSTRPVTRFSE